MAIRSIPPRRKPSSSPYGINVYRSTKRVRGRQRTHSSTLEALLVEAERLESEQVEVVKLLSFNEELERLDRLQRAINQLKRQITLNRNKKAAQASGIL